MDSGVAIPEEVRLTITPHNYKSSNQTTRSLILVARDDFRETPIQSGYDDFMKAIHALLPNEWSDYALEQLQEEKKKYVK